MKQTTNTKKLALAGVLTALAIVGSFLSFPVAGSKCAPVQHMVSIPSVGIIQIRFKWVETVTRLLSAGSDQLPFDNI